MLILIDAEAHGEETVVEVHGWHDITLHFRSEKAFGQHMGIGNDGTHGVGKVLEPGRGDARPHHSARAGLQRGAVDAILLEEVALDSFIRGSEASVCAVGLQQAHEACTTQHVVEITI